MILQIIISNEILDLVTGILAKISLVTGIWAKFRLGTGNWYPPFTTLSRQDRAKCSNDQFTLHCQKLKEDEDNLKILLFFTNRRSR